MTQIDNAGEVADQMAIEQLIYQYAQAFDSCDSAAFAECFSPNAVLTGTSLTWRGDFAKHLEALWGPARPNNQKILGIHHMFNHLYTVQGRAASGVTYCRATLKRDKDTELTHRNMYVRYRDELVKNGDRWQFLKREFEILCFTHAMPAERLAMDG